MNLFRRIYDWWNPPCPKHPGHRKREVDTDIMAPMQDLPLDMCSECFREWNEEILGN